MGWSVVEELGIHYAPQSGARVPRLLLSPVYAAHAHDGGYLIVDEMCTEKPIPFRMEYRTIRVDVRGNVFFDTAKLGIDDGYGCLFETDSVAILRRTKWELTLFSPYGVVTDRVDLTRFSKYLPRLVSWTNRNTFLISFLDRSGRLDIVELDRKGRLVWYLPARADFLGVPASIQLSQRNTLLVADAFHHVIWELDREGEVVWQFGKAGDPARSLDRVSGASCVRASSDGQRIITDTRNHRLLLVGVDGTSSLVGPDEGLLCDPTFADFGANGNLLICDSGNARVIELDNQQRIVWQYGETIRTRRQLCFPRSVVVAETGEYLIADTANDRVVKSAPGQQLEKQVCAAAGLFWPRCARVLPSGSLIIADGRRGRIIEIGRNGEIVHELSEIKWSRSQRLQDPHDVRILPNGHLLVADSPQDVVLELDWFGNVHRAVGGDGGIDLADPHSAQQLDDGTWAICDTGHSRVLLIDEQGSCYRCIENIDGGDFVSRLNLPKYLEVGPDGTALIVDTGNNRVLAATMAGRLLWEIASLPDSPIPGFNQPRWATLVNQDEVLISDHFHHRVVHLRRS